MPNTHSARAAVLGLGRQTAEGAALVVPKFEIPMGGGFVGPERAIEEFPWTFDFQDSAGFYVARNSGLFDVTVPLMAKSSVAAIQSVLGSRTTTGAGPFTHDLVAADNLPFYSWFFRQPGNNFWTLADAKSGSFQFNFASGAPLSLSLNGLGKTPTRADAKWGAATVVEGPPSDAFFTMIGAVIKFDVDDTTPTTVIHNVGSGNIGMNRNLEGIQTDGIGYHYLAEQKRDTSITFDNAVLEDNTVINKIFTGAAAGTTLSDDVIPGSAELLFVDSIGTPAAQRSIRFTLSNVLWTVDQIPQADPGGGVARYTITGRAAKPASGAALSVRVINAESGANY